MLVEIELLPQGLPHGVQSMPKNLKKVQIYPNLVITLLEVNSLTAHNTLRFLCGKQPHTSPNKRENQNFGAVTRFFVSYLFGFRLLGICLVLLFLKGAFFPY